MNHSISLEHYTSISGIFLIFENIIFLNLGTQSGSEQESNRKKRCHSPLLSLLSDLKKEDTEDRHKDKKVAGGRIDDPLLTFQASWMDNNLFDELEEMDSITKSNKNDQRRPPLLSFDSVDSVGGEAERLIETCYHII